MQELKLPTDSRITLVDITEKVSGAIAEMTVVKA